jgi:hypothetical protein
VVVNAGVAKSTKSKGAKNGSGAEEDNMTGAADNNGKRVGDKVHRNLLECHQDHLSFCHYRSRYAVCACLCTVCPSCVLPVSTNVAGLNDVVLTLCTSYRRSVAGAGAGTDSADTPDPDSETEVFLFFATSEHGILMQDSFPRKQPYGDMIGLNVPRLYFRNQVGSRV